MSNELDDILKGHPGDDAEKRKSLGELHDDLHADDAFDQDSAEGLAQFDREKLPVTIEQLNAQLRRHTGKKKRRRKPAGNNSYVYIAVITIILLIILAYIVIKKI